MTDTKAKILNAASELFLEGGASALSVRAISKRAGLSTIGIYSHFQGKQGILDALYIEGFGYVSNAVNVEEQEEGPLERIIIAAERYLQMAAHHKAHYKLVFGEGDSSYEPSEEAKSAGRTAFEELVNQAAKALPDGVSWAQKQEFAVGIWALLHGYVSLSDHAVTNLVETQNWRDMILKSLTAYVQAQLEAFSH